MKPKIVPILNGYSDTGACQDFMLLATRCLIVARLPLGLVFLPSSNRIFLGTCPKFIILSVAELFIAVLA